MIEKKRHSTTLSMTRLATGEPCLIRIDAYLTHGTPTLYLIGVGDTFRTRVQSACRTVSRPWRTGTVTVNLTPALAPRHMPLCGLAVAAGILAAQEAIPMDGLADTVLIGDVDEHGTVPPFDEAPDILVEHARIHGVNRIILPAATLAHATIPNGIEAIGVNHLADLRG